MLFKKKKIDFADDLEGFLSCSRSNIYALSVKVWYCPDSCIRLFYQSLSNFSLITEEF